VAGYSKWKEENFNRRLQGKALMWPKLPRACGRSTGAQQGQPEGEYVIAGFSVGRRGKAHTRPARHLPNPDLDQEEARGQACIPKAQSDKLTALGDSLTP
jgi:hypothetical protein